MTEPIFDIDDTRWVIGNDAEDGVVIRLCDGPDPDELFFLDRANATRLAIALATALAAKPVPQEPIGVGYLGEQLEFDFDDGDARPGPC